MQLPKATKESTITEPTTEQTLEHDVKSSKVANESKEEANELSMTSGNPNNESKITVRKMVYHKRASHIPKEMDEQKQLPVIPKAALPDQFSRESLFQVNMDRKSTPMFPNLQVQSSSSLVGAPQSN